MVYHCLSFSVSTRYVYWKLYSNFGIPITYGHEELTVCEDIDQVHAVVEKYPPYQPIFTKMSYGETQMLDEGLFMKKSCITFLLIILMQFQYAVFFGYIRLREQEMRNLMWISECVAQNQNVEGS
ncbi:V-type proton ATPase subunit d1-like [Ananas comosus]|uniref:V-type proton ATPase subunit d1-like n=1 Tax=Ananas comosus TaxID=4615 RepID=A0A6P5GCM9_ANACO|nr:V-type proton ATPase subunit d1-like [Ananas comosus]